MVNKIKIIFWKLVALAYDYRPKNWPRKYTDRPFAWRWDNDEYDFTYPDHIKILHEWREAGKHWIIYTR